MALTPSLSSIAYECRYETAIFVTGTPNDTAGGLIYSFTASLCGKRCEQAATRFTEPQNAICQHTILRSQLMESVHPCC